MCCRKDTSTSSRCAGCGIGLCNLTILVTIWCRSEGAYRWLFAYVRRGAMPLAVLAALYLGACAQITVFSDNAPPQTEWKFGVLAIDLANSNENTIVHSQRCRARIDALRRDARAMRTPKSCALAIECRVVIATKDLEAIVQGSRTAASSEDNTQSLRGLIEHRGSDVDVEIDVVCAAMSLPLAGCFHNSPIISGGVRHGRRIRIRRTNLGRRQLHLRLQGRQVRAGSGGSEQRQHAAAAEQGWKPARLLGVRDARCRREGRSRVGRGTRAGGRGRTSGGMGDAARTDNADAVRNEAPVDRRSQATLARADRVLMTGSSRSEDGKAAAARKSRQPGKSAQSS